MGRPPKWNHRTISIRVPAHLAEHLLEVAKRLDNSFTFGQNSALNNLNSFVQKPQSILFSYERPGKIIQLMLSNMLCDIHVWEETIEVELKELLNPSVFKTYN